MTEPIFPFPPDPAGRSPEDRARAVAALLATGLVRLGSALIPAAAPPTAPAENVSESRANQLAVPAQKSVTVSPG